MSKVILNLSSSFWLRQQLLLEALIPPSNAAILFSALTNVPVSQTFAAGMIPGLILLCLMILVVLVKCRNIRNPEPASSAERWQSFLGAMPGLFTPIIILGGIYAGLLTPSESAAVAGVWAIFMGFFIYRELTLKSLQIALRETANNHRHYLCHNRDCHFFECCTYLQSNTPTNHSLFH